jgi:hypothetical protein
VKPFLPSRLSAITALWLVVRPIVQQGRYIHNVFIHLKMRSLQVALLCFICIGKGYGQIATNRSWQIVVAITKEENPKNIYATVEITSNFPGGDSTWIQSLENNINRSIPYSNGAPKGKYIVSVTFIVAKDYSISDVRCVTDPGYGMCETVVRAVKKAPKWVPASGVPVRVVDTYRQ